jgi:hypothetical protein
MLLEIDPETRPGVRPMPRERAGCTTPATARSADIHNLAHLVKPAACTGIKAPTASHAARVRRCAE